MCVFVVLMCTRVPGGGGCLHIYSLSLLLSLSLPPSLHSIARRDLICLLLLLLLLSVLGLHFVFSLSLSLSARCSLCTYTSFLSNGPWNRCRRRRRLAPPSDMVRTNHSFI